MDAIVVRGIRPGKLLTVYRIVMTGDRGSPLLADSLRSHYERGRPPRGAEFRAAVIHMGLSVYLSDLSARATAHRYPQIGTFIAELRLRGERGFNYAATGQPGHLTIWGDPIKLQEAIVAIRAARG
jgi:hypothetical protein